VLGSGGDISPEESMVVDDRLTDYNSSLSSKFNAALKEEEENNELDYFKTESAAEEGSTNELDNDNDTLFDEMAQEMDYLIEMDEDIKAMECQRDEPTINENEPEKPTSYEPSYGITKSIWSEESLHNWEKIGHCGESTNTSSRSPVKESEPTDTVYPKEDELPSIKNTSAWFDIHQFRGWQTIDKWQPLERINTSNTLEINVEETSVGSNISRESLESPLTEPFLPWDFTYHLRCAQAKLKIPGEN